jgi:hypothetical protein
MSRGGKEGKPKFGEGRIFNKDSFVPKPDYSLEIFSIGILFVAIFFTALIFHSHKGIGTEVAPDDTPVARERVVYNSALSERLRS